MSEIERTIAEELAKVPVVVREKFLLMAQGAAVAVECAREAAETGEPSSAGCAGTFPQGKAEDEKESA